jgi:hypothetical protein
MFAAVIGNYLDMIGKKRAMMIGNSLAAMAGLGLAFL